MVIWIERKVESGFRTGFSLEHNNARQLSCLQCVACQNASHWLQQELNLLLWGVLQCHWQRGTDAPLAAEVSYCVWMVEARLWTRVI